MLGTLIIRLIGLINFLIETIKEHYIIVSFIIIFLYLLLSKKESGNFYKKIIFQKGYTIIGGLFNEGKTFLLTNFAKKAKEAKIFVISNFYNGYNFLNFSSKKDLHLLLEDLLILGEYQNFNDVEFKEIYKKDLYYKKYEERKNLNKYKYLKKNGYHNKFLFIGDEFHIYFDSREAMGNFKTIKIKKNKNDEEDKEEEKEIKKLSILMHQIRHFNTSFIIASQKIMHIDNRIRELASYEIEIKKSRFFYLYNLFSGFNEKRMNLDENFKKLNKFMIIKFNVFEINIILKNIEIFVNILFFNFNKLIKFFKINYEVKKFSIFQFQKLKFNSKYNVDNSFNIYKKGDLFIKLNNFYKENNEFKNKFFE